MKFNKNNNIRRKNCFNIDKLFGAFAHAMAHQVARVICLCNEAQESNHLGMLVNSNKMFLSLSLLPSGIEITQSLQIVYNL